MAALATLSVAVTRFVNHSGWTLYYGDAEAHLNIARRIVDSRNPGYDQIGTVWLPLPHLLMLPFVRSDAWWHNGLAGAVPSSICFVVSGAFLFLAMRRATSSAAAAFAALGIFALNPNLLYLQATPMTEPVFLAGFMGLLYFSVLFAQTQWFGAVIGAGLASLVASMARYEGWFVIPFAAIYFLAAARRHRFLVALTFGVIAALGPLYWLAHNWWLYANPFEFYTSPYSATQRALKAGTEPYPGFRDWAKSALYYSTAARLCVGWTAIVAAAVGALVTLGRRILWPMALTALAPIFYIWSMHSGGAPIFVPPLWPNTYYNTRYGLAALPLIAVAGAGITLIARARWRPYVALASVLAPLAVWAMHPLPDNWICWKESQVNSDTRRVWTKQAAAMLAAEYRPGEGIFTTFGDLSGILREAGIPLRQSLHEGNEPAWMAATTRPDLFLHEEWALTFSGETVATTVEHATLKTGPRYHLVRLIMLRNAPVIKIYKRD